MKPLLASCFGLALAVGLSGCSVPLPTRNGVHYVVVGFGVVSVPKNAGEEAVLVTRTHALGATANNGPGARLTLGYSAGSIVSIPTNASDVRVEISALPGSPLRVEAPSAVLNPISK